MMNKLESNYTCHSDDNRHYNLYQTVLPLDLGVIIEPDDEVISFLQVIDRIDLNAYFKKGETRGRKGYCKTDMLKVILFAYMTGHYHTREIAKLCRTDIRFMFLMKEERPSHTAFADFMRNYLLTDIDNIFFDIVKTLLLMMHISPSVQFIDGTKIEAYANKYSFVYKKRIINNREKLFIKLSSLIRELNARYLYSYPVSDRYCAQETGYIVQYLMEVMVNEGIMPVYGKGTHKHEIQRFYDRFMEFYLRLLDYEYWLFIIGDDRNSCTKTDLDAVMGRLKIDYYCNTGLSRPCYNVQIAVSDGVITNADVSQHMSDTAAFIPFMERFNAHYGFYPVFPVADAGYGSYANYWYAMLHDMQLVMKYSSYARKNLPAVKKDPYNTGNWATNVDGTKQCPNGCWFNKRLPDRAKLVGGYLSITQRFTTEGSCTGCEHAEKCFKGKNHEQKVISRNEVLRQFYEKVDENLSTEYGKELKKQRSIQAEGAFGVIKEDMKFTRFSRRGLENTKMEFLLVCLGYNFRKYHKYREGTEEEAIEIIN